MHILLVQVPAAINSSDIFPEFCTFAARVRDFNSRNELFFCSLFSKLNISNCNSSIIVATKGKAKYKFCTKFRENHSADSRVETGALSVMIS
jgi:hypothetical protein